MYRPRKNHLQMDLLDSMELLLKHQIFLQHVRKNYTHHRYLHSYQMNMLQRRLQLLDRHSILNGSHYSLDGPSSWLFANHLHFEYPRIFHRHLFCHLLLPNLYIHQKQKHADNREIIQGEQSTLH